MKIVVIIVLSLRHVLMDCPEEVQTANGIKIVWPESRPGQIVKSNPLCYNNASIVTRKCIDNQWFPSAKNLRPCQNVLQESSYLTCPPSFHQVSKNVKEFCYQISSPSSWDYPCLKSGGPAVITDFEDIDIDELLISLKEQNISRYFWLPARRAKIFTPIIWYVIGSKWGSVVESYNKLKISASIFKNCLLLDIESKIIIAETCTLEYPSLCFYINSIYYPARCPKNYHSVRYVVDEAVCLGIEYSETNLSYDEFQDKCKTPMGEADTSELSRFVFKKIADLSNMSDVNWCWFAKMPPTNQKYEISNPTIDEEIVTTEKPIFVYISINNIGTLSVMDSSVSLSCMACQTKVLYDHTEFIFEYIEDDNALYLTVYYPSGLWKYDEDEKGIQCFSDATGSTNIIEINVLTNITYVNDRLNYLYDGENIEKTTYKIDLVANRSAQYWCEGHTKNFSLISTEKIVVNPKNGRVQVFSLVLDFYIECDDIQNQLENYTTTVCTNIQHIFNANKVLLMENLAYSQNRLMILVHMHVSLEKYDKNYEKNLPNLKNVLKNIAETELINYNYTFINITSSMYCMPTVSLDNLRYLNWELTPIGHVTAPKQFCLQENGLPVTRFCGGSYLFGGHWDNVEGTCNTNYVPSLATTFLYKFVKGQVPKNYTLRFLTDGLNFVLEDVSIIIPADIYYLAMSFQHILSITRENKSTVDMGNIENIAWIMDRLMILNNDYLRLAQTLNSTNVILDTVSEIIELITQEGKEITQKRFCHSLSCSPYYDFAVKPQFIIQVSYPETNNISGIAVAKKSTSDLFTDMEITPLYRNTSLDDILTIDDLEIAAWLPDAAVKSFIKNTNYSFNENDNDEDLHLIINVFYNNAMFQELKPNNYVVNGRIIGLTVPGYISKLQYPVIIVYKDLQNISQGKYCGFWDFHTDIGTKVPGYWSNRGCYYRFTKNNLSICECYHLTHFGQLLNIRNVMDDTNSSSMKRHIKPLNIISLIGSFLSLIGIIGIWITASVFVKWRQKVGTKVLLNLSGSIALPLIFIIIFNLGNSIFQSHDTNRVITTCIILGALLHYSVLASFMWMLITAFLQFIRYVRVLGVHRPSRFLMKFTLIGWGAPAIPVVIILFLNKDNYVPQLDANKNYIEGSICYPTGLYLIFGIVLPVCVILLVNVSLYILVMCAISRGPDGKVRSADMDLIGAQFKLSIFLFFLLGLTWIFGIVSFSNNYIWSYLFCLTSTLQGFVLFIYFIICDPETRNLWISLMTSQTRSSFKSRESVTSISSG